jgi:serine protease AprX
MLPSAKSILFLTLIALLWILPSGLSQAWSNELSGNPQDASQTLFSPKESPVINSSCQRFISECSPLDTVKIWVFFTDKSIFSEKEYQEAKRTYKNSLLTSTLKRRLKNKVEVNFLDLPVNQDYVEELVQLGGRLRHISRWLNAASIQIEAGKIEMIAKLLFVRQIRKVASFKRSLPEKELDYGELHLQKDFIGYGRNYGKSLAQLDQINVPVVHDMGFKGEDVIVGMLDTGYRKDHQAFAAAYLESRVLAEYDFIFGDTNTQNEPEDTVIQHDHGTNTWSALGGEYDGELYGPAFKSKFVLAKTENTRGEEPIEEDNWVAGLEWSDSIGAEVVSSSLGYLDWYTYEDLDGNTALCTQAADLAASRGIVVATAAGNERLEDWHYIITPADGDSVIAVGAVNSEGVIANFSSVGPTYDGRIKPEVVARGVNTYCAFASGVDHYAGQGGTSLSTPLVGGCAAVLFSAHPDWNAMQMREALMMTADRAFSPDTVYGWGLVDLFAALNYNPSGALAIDHDPPLFTTDTLNTLSISAIITTGNGLIEDSLYLYWRSDTLSPFLRQSLQSVGPNQYQAQIPAQSPGTILYYYLSARDSFYYVVNLPLGAPNFVFKYHVATDFIAFDFEGGLFYWETGGTNNSWNITSVDAHGGTFSLNDSPKGGYDNNTDSWTAIKQSFDLSDATNPQFSFWHTYQFLSGDTGFVEINTNGGKSWERLLWFADTLHEWTQASIPLDSYTGQTDLNFRFRLVTDDVSYEGDGWYIDDVRFNFKPTSVEEEPGSVPFQFSLGQSYPNPFNPTTTIPFTVHGSQFTVHRHIRTTLKIYNIRGQLVRTLLDEEKEPGEYSVSWNGKDERGKEVASGLYFYQLIAGDKKITKRMVLLK